MKNLKGYLVGLFILIGLYLIASSIGDSNDSHSYDCVDYGKGGYYC